jgi:hypothetical protein
MNTMKTPQTFIQQHPGFCWWVTDIQNLDDSAILEATLTYGHMEDRRELLEIMGTSRFSQEFRSIVGSRRAQNLEPRTIAYWTYYLSVHHA